MILSAAPITLNYGYDNNISVSSGVVHTFDNIDFSNSSIFVSAKDVTLNRDELLILTDNIKLSNCLSTEFIPTPEQYVYGTLIKNSDNYYLYATSSASSGSLISTTTNISLATVFNFYFPASANTVQIFYTIKNADGSTADLYLINNAVDIISGGNAGSFNINHYTYSYILSGDSLSLITINPASASLWLNKNLSFGGLSASTYNNLIVPATNIFKAVRYNNENYNYSLQRPGQSDLVKYTKTDNSLDINNSSGSNSFNYLISSAFKTLSANTQSLSANINTLKNYYSPLHEQSTVLNSQLRSYTKIYTGLNETDGHDKIHLGYNASTSKIVFKSGINTYFHYPNSTSTLPLSTSTLVDSGSYADIVPVRSDKIFKKVANYKNYTNWGDSNSTPLKGVYVCSWLSAGTTTTGGLNNTIRPVWMDRYYDPTYINKIGINLSTITALSGILTDSTNNYPNIIYDVPSSLTFEPGVLYYYNRIGEPDNTIVVNSLSGLQYHFNEWGPSLINKVNSLTAGKIPSFTSSNSAYDVSVKTPYYIIGKHPGFINTVEYDFSYNKGNTLSFFAYNADWDNIKGDQILGNYFDGGMGILVSNPILTPFFTVNAWNYTSPLSAGTVRTYNADLTLLNYESYTTFIAANTPAPALATPSFAIKGNYDESYYVIDNSSARYLSVFDPDDLLTKKISLAGAPTLSSGTTIVDTYLVKYPNVDTQFLITKSHTVYNNVVYNKFTTSGDLVSSSTSTIYNNFTIDLSGNPRYYNTNIPTAYTNAVSGYEMWKGTGACVNSNNIIYSLSGNGVSGIPATAWVIAKDNIPILGITNPENINCDHEDNLWVTYNTNFLAKINSDGKILWSKQINTGDPIITNYSDRNINFLAQESAGESIVYYALLLDGKSEHIYKIDMNGLVIKKLYIPGLLPGGDCTGFNYQRQYIKPFTRVPGIKAKLVVKDSTLLEPVPIYITLNYSVSGLAVGWHHFALTYDETNNAKLYVDGNLVNQTTYTNPTTGISYQIFNYKNNPQLSIGASSFKTGFLNEWIQTPDTYLFNGNVADIRFYNITLNNSDIRALAHNYQHNQFNSLSWAIPTETRGYIEEIERFFLHRMPGSKSQHFNVKIKNSAIVDPHVRSIIETNIRNAVTSIAPVYTKLRSIIWE